MTHATYKTYPNKTSSKISPSRARNRHSRWKGHQRIDASKSDRWKWYLKLRLRRRRHRVPLKAAHVRWDGRLRVDGGKRRQRRRRRDDYVSGVRRRRAVAKNLRQRWRAQTVEARGWNRFGLRGMTGWAGQLLDHVPEIVLADVVHLGLRLGGESVLFIEGVVVSEALRRLKKSWFLNVVGFGDVMWKLVKLFEILISVGSRSSSGKRWWWV